MSGKRSNPVSVAESYKPDKHEQMCSDMSSAVYALQDKVRKPFQSDGEKLLPKGLRSSEKPEAKAARKHIERLHKAFKSPE